MCRTHGMCLGACVSEVDGGAQAAPGWYGDPFDQRLERYFDGSSWTASTRSRPVAPLAPPEGQPYEGALPPPPPAYGGPALAGVARSPGQEAWIPWLIALAPVLGVLVALGLSTYDPQLAYFGWAVTLALNIALSVWDERRLTRAGLLPAGGLLGWAIFLIPVYLYKRQRAVGQTLAVPVVWVVAFCLALASDAVLPRLVGVPINIPVVESQVEVWMEKQIGTNVSVDCPDRVSVRPGETFKCIATAPVDGSTAVVTVTLQNTDGDIIWEVG